MGAATSAGLPQCWEPGGRTTRATPLLLGTLKVALTSLGRLCGWLQERWWCRERAARRAHNWQHCRGMPCRRQKRKAPAKQPGAFEGVLLVRLRPHPYGVRFPNQMKLALPPSMTVIVQPNPVAQPGPLVGKLSCQPVCTVSQTV